MRLNLFLTLGLLVGISVIPAAAQDVQVSRQNKTIAVTADDSVTAEPEIATVSFGYRSFGPTQDAAFQDNVRISRQIVNSLLAAHLAKENIETSKLRLGLADADEKWTPELKKQRQFEAEQSWKILVPISQVSNLVEVATQAGVNDIQGVSWNVIDPSALQAKASGAALGKARSIAEQMAEGLHAKLGDLVYASNKSPDEGRLVEAFWSRRDDAVVVTKSGDRANVEVYPQKVKSSATVHAVFALE